MSETLDYHQHEDGVIVESPTAARTPTATTTTPTSIATTTTTKKMQLDHIIPTPTDEPIANLVSKFSNQEAYLQLVPCRFSAMGLFLIFLMNGNLQSQPLAVPLVFQILTPFVSLAIALYSDYAGRRESTTSSCYHMKRKPLLLMQWILLLICHFLRLISPSSEFLFGLTELIRYGVFTLANAMRVEGVLYDDDYKTFGLCQIMQTLGWFLMTLTNKSFWLSWILALFGIVVTAIAMGPLQDYLVPTTSTVADSCSTAVNNDESLLEEGAPASTTESAFTTFAWKVFDWLQTKATLFVIIFTLVWNATLTSIQTMNILDGNMEDWYIPDQWIYALTSVLATGGVVALTYHFKKDEEQKPYGMIWIVSVVTVVIVTAWGFISAIGLRFGANAFGTSAVVAVSQYALLLLWLRNATPVTSYPYVATSWCLLEWFRTGLAPQMGEQLFFVTTFSYSFFWITYVCWAILPLLTLWWLYYTKKQQQQESSLSPEQELNTITVNAGEEDNTDMTTTTNNKDSSLLIRLTFGIVFFFIIVQLYWMFGYPRIVANTDGTDYYHSDYFWIDWSLYLAYRVVFL